jgi:hypothetical protein
LRSLPAAKNATNRLSGDQNGYTAPSVPGRGLAVSVESDRMNSLAGPEAVAAKTMCRPSGETAKFGTWPANMAFSGAGTVNCTGSSAAVARRSLGAA